MKKLLIVLGLIFLASATGYQEILDKRSEAPIAKAVQSLIEMNMSGSEERLQEIADLLYDIQAVIDQQQRDHDAFIEGNRQQCASDLATYNDQLQTAQGRLEDSLGEQSDLQEEQSEKTRQAAEEQQNNDEIVQSIQENNQQLTDETDAWNNYRTTFEDAIAACEEAIRLLSGLAHGNATSFIQKGKGSSIMFVQMGQKFTDVKKILENHVKLAGPASFVQPIIDVLSQMGNQAKVDQGAVVQVIELIQTLLQRLREGLIDREAQHGQVTTDLNQLISSLDKSLTASNSQLEILNGRLGAIDSRLSELSGIIAATQEIVAAKQKLIDDTQADCDAEETRYETETQSRTADLAVLAKLIEYFESQVVSNVSNVRDEAFDV